MEIWMAGWLATVIYLIWKGHAEEHPFVFLIACVLLLALWPIEILGRVANGR
jgi:hypothetical protein